MAPVQVPPVTLEDLQAFQAKHFPGSVPPSQLESQCNTNIAEEIEEDDDALGYYPDGVKRTLTDEQIRIFRHSEIHALLREKQLREESLSEESSPAAEAQNSEERAHPEMKPETKIAESEAKGDKSEQRRTVVPKQTNATVSEASLDYSEEGADKTGASKRLTSEFMGRRIISYDD